MRAGQFNCYANTLAMSVDSIHPRTYCNITFWGIKAVKGWRGLCRRFKLAKKC